MKDKKYYILYRRTRIPLDFNPRTGTCACCGRTGKTDMHHLLYAYKTEEVRKQPELALKNTVELCPFFCHLVADSMRIIKEHNLIYNKLIALKI